MGLIITPELLARIAGASAGKIVVSDGTTWVASTPTFPNASATSGKIIKSDGTNWAASTETYAAPGTSGNLLTSDGTNWTSAAATAHAVYAAASPPTVDVGLFVIAKTGVDFKTAATTDIFTVPTSRRYVLTNLQMVVTAVTAAGAGVITLTKVQESGANAAMNQTVSTGSSTPAVGTSYSFPTSTTFGWSTCAAANKVQLVLGASEAGSTAVSGTVFVTGFYSA